MCVILTKKVEHITFYGDYGMTGLILGRGVRMKSAKMKSHIHEQYEVYYLAKGNMRYMIEDKIYEISKGDVALVPRGVIHNTAYGNESTERLLINFSSELIEFPELLSTFEKHVIHLSQSEASEFESVFKKLERECTLFDTSHPNAVPSKETDRERTQSEGKYHIVHKKSDTGCVFPAKSYLIPEESRDYSYYLVRHYISEILVLLSRNNVRVRNARLGGYVKIMQSAVKYINECFGEPITLDNLAQKYSLSRSFFCRKFKEVTGFGICEYITLTRVKAAEKLLRTTSLSVTDIAFTCGFNDSSYFAATFKKLMGVTPHKIRVTEE